MSDGLGLFGGKYKPDVKTGWELYQKGLEYNNSIKLNDNVRVNENFYIGKQWEGVDSNGLPTPQFNFLKRVVGFVIANITTDNIKVNATALAHVPNEDSFSNPVRIVNEEFAAIIERNNLPALFREYARNAAVDGDGCLYTYWDDKMENGQRVKGGIRTEVVENTRVFFGNPNNKDVEAQPYIIISTRKFVRDAKRTAKANGIEEWQSISADEESTAVDNAKVTDDKVTELRLFWRDEESREIWEYEFTQTGEIRKPRSLGIKLYPISWLPWDLVQDSYHGQALMSGLIPNQIFINKAWAMSMLSIMKMAFPKVIYDKTKIRNWDNRVGSSIAVHGDVNTVAKIMDPAAISPQIAQFIELAQNMSEECLGATGAALGEGRADNTSAIVALQRAASTPTELNKQALYSSIEDLFRIYLEFMVNFYGKRVVDIEPPEKVREAMMFAGQDVPAMIPTEFDFASLEQHQVFLKLEAGASSYYSEIAALSTLDNLLLNGHINIVQYLERVPDSHVPAKRKLIAELKNAMAPAPQAMPQLPPAEQGGMPPSPSEEPPIPTSGGYSELQRAINESGSTEGIV